MACYCQVVAAIGELQAQWRLAPQKGSPERVEEPDAATVKYVPRALVGFTRAAHLEVEAYDVTSTGTMIEARLPAKSVSPH